MGMIFNLLSLEEETVSQLKNSTLDIETFLYGDGGGDRSLNIDKSWEIIHFVLTGKTLGDGETPGILAQLILGGTEIGDDMGYGPAHLLEIREVKAIAEELEKVTVEKFIEIFKGRDFSNTPLYAFNYEDLEAEMEYASNYFDQLREYYLGAASGNLFMLLYLS